MKRLTNTLIAAPGLALLTCGMAQANLILNPEFTTYAGLAPKNLFSDVQPVDWTGGGYLQWVDAPGTATVAAGGYGGGPVYGPFPINPSGGNFLESDGDPNYSQPISQTINGLTAGPYTVSFYQAAGEWDLPQYNSTTTEQWEVSLGSQTQFSTVMTTPAQGVTPWELQSLTFTVPANTTSELLTFFAVGTPTGEPPMTFLDGPDMESSVPEPSNVLLLAGVGAVLGIGRLVRRVRAHRAGAAG